MFVTAECAERVKVLCCVLCLRYVLYSAERERRYADTLPEDL
jgi:hypothetical protein